MLLKSHSLYAEIHSGRGEKNESSTCKSKSLPALFLLKIKTNYQLKQELGTQLYHEHMKKVLQEMKSTTRDASAVVIDGQPLRLTLNSRPVCAEAFFRLYGISRNGIKSILREIAHADDHVVEHATAWLHSHPAHVEFTKKTRVEDFLLQLQRNYSYEHEHEWIVSVPSREDAWNWFSRLDKDTDRVSFEYFEQIWSKQFSFMVCFDQHHTCRECVRYDANKDPEGKRQHLNRAHEQRRASQNSATEARRENSRMCVLSRLPDFCDFAF